MVPESVLIVLSWSTLDEFSITLMHTQCLCYDDSTLWQNVGSISKGGCLVEEGETGLVEVEEGIIINC